MKKTVIKEAYRQAAAIAVSAAIRVFIEKNPGFSGTIGILVARSQEKHLTEELKSKNLKRFNELKLETLTVSALSTKGVQSRARALTRENYPRIQLCNITFAVSDTYAHVVLKL